MRGWRWLRRGAWALVVLLAGAMLARAAADPPGRSPAGAAAASAQDWLPDGDGAGLSAGLIRWEA